MRGERNEQFESRNTSRVLAEALWDKADIVLQIEMKHEQFTVRYGSSEEDLVVLAVADGKEINPEKVGCMTGTIIGMFASGNGTESSNYAAFDFFELS